MSTMNQRFQDIHPKSLELAERARGVFPDGVTHDARRITPYPIYMTNGQGAYKWDVDGNRYIDYVIGHGALILGHSHSKVVEAVGRQIAQGTHLGGSTGLEIEWAEAIKKLVPCAEKVRFVSSGTEATLMAMRLSRAYTGKQKILKFKSHFHGWNDYAVIGEERGSSGVPDATRSTVVVVEPGDIALVEAALEADKDIAAVILEPTGAHGGLLPLAPSFLHELRELTTRTGVMLIFDEVVTGFRVARGGAQERYDVTPDLSTHAKILAGGLPGGAVVGRTDVLDMIQHRNNREWDQNSRVSHPGTFNANPISAVAGATALGIIADEPINDYAEALAMRLRDGFNSVLNRTEVPGFAYGVSSIVFGAFGVDGEVDDDGICTVPHAALNKGTTPELAMALRTCMLNEGLDNQGGRTWRLSSAHTEADVDFTINAFEKIIGTMRKEGLV